MNNKKVIIALLIAIIMVFSSAAIVFNSVSSNPNINVNTATTHNTELQNAKYYPVPSPDGKGFNKTGNVLPSMNINIQVYVPLENSGYLQSLTNDLNAPGNPLYHHFLNYSEIQQQFINMNQYNLDLHYLKHNGFKIISSSAPIIVASAPASMVESHLGLNVGIYSNGTSSYYYGTGTPILANSIVTASNISNLLFAKPSTLVTEKQFQNEEKKLGSQNETVPLEAYSPKYLEQVYNATGLYKMGYNGTGQTIGILDYYGDPFIKDQLSYFDHEFNISAPPEFNITPIGAYHPYCGIVTGWAGEISLDVESSHTMAPGANITLYIANGCCDLASAIAYIDSQDKVSSLSQSFSSPDSEIMAIGGSYYALCEQTTNAMYMIGAAEGITFSASSGDAGASGYSTGALGSVGYPSTSPYVVAVGGTSTYLDIQNGNLTSFNQTAWSNYGFVPDNINYGGSTGGVSILQPRPSYQNGLETGSYPNGKLIPEISFEATVYPGFLYVMPGNATRVTGGTSEASPIFAGLVALLDQYEQGKTGSLSPAINTLAHTDYSKAFIPVTFGYNIPYTSHYGYNLVTGWGSLNIANFAMGYKAMDLSKSLSIMIRTSYTNTTNINASNETALSEYMPGQTITIDAPIHNSLGNYNATQLCDALINGTYNSVTKGTFKASLITLDGNLTTITLNYNSTINCWVGHMLIPSNANGPSYINVYGSNSTGISGSNEVNIFTGYFISLSAPASGSAYSLSYENGFVTGYVTSLNGTVVKDFNVKMNLDAYSIFNNTYYKVGSVTLTNDKGTLEGFVTGNYNITGPSLLVGTNAFAIIPFDNGADLQGSIILGPNIVEPGAVGAGQYIYVEGSVAPPENVFSGFAAACSNITFELYNTSDKMVSSTTMKPIDLEYPNAVPELYVPKDSTPGLYTILIKSSYDSSTYGYINGTFYGQIYVSNAITPQIHISKYTYEGQNMNVYANITYPNGTEVQYGMFSATFYPAVLSTEYYEISAITQVNMNYNATLNMWVGTLKLPSYYNDGSFGHNYEGLTCPPAELPPGPYYVYVSGVSANAYPTTTAQSAQMEFEIEPYQYLNNVTMHALPVNNGLAFNNVTLMLNGSITSSVFLSNNMLSHSNIYINRSTGNTLYVNNSVVYLSDSQVNNIVARNSKIVLECSSISNLDLVSSKLVNLGSSVEKISPGKPTLAITSPVYSKTYTGTVNVDFNVSGSNIEYTQLLIDNKMVYNTTKTGSLTYSFNTTTLPDGTYAVELKSVQTDGISNSTQTKLNIDNSAASLHSKVTGLNNKVSSLTTDMYVAIGVAIAGIISGVGAISYVFKKR